MNGSGHDSGTEANYHVILNWIQDLVKTGF